MKHETKKKERAKSDGLIAGGGALSALAALIGASCCVLPILLVNLGVSTALAGNLTFFARARPYLMAVAIALIGIGFVAAFWKGRRPSRRVLSLLIIASVLTGGAYLFPYYEPEILQWLGAP